MNASDSTNSDFFQDLDFSRNFAQIKRLQNGNRENLKKMTHLTLKYTELGNMKYGIFMDCTGCFSVQEYANVLQCTRYRNMVRCT